MAITVKVAEYYYANVEDEPGEARRLLAFCSAHKISLVNFTSFPVSQGKAQIDFFPENPEQLKAAAEEANISLVGPKKAFLIQGSDRIGALYDFHLKLSNAGVNIYACNGVVDGTGRFGYVIWVAPKDFEAAAVALKSSDWRTIQPSKRT